MPTTKPLFAPELTDGYPPELVRQIKQSHPGMAHFAATGPLGTFCRDCGYFGLWRQIRNRAGEVVQTTFHHDRCGKFRELTNRVGPQIPGESESCRHFRRRDEQQ